MTAHPFSARPLGSVVAVLVVGLAACGGGSSGSNAVASLSKSSKSSGATNTKSSKTSRADFRKQLFAYAACMRTNGVDFPDPQFDANGRPQFNQGSGGQNFGDLRNSPKFATAQKACAATQPDFAGQFQRTPAQQAAQRKSLLKYAKCMRSKGIDFPDPTFDASGRRQFGSGTDGGPQGQDRSDPAVQVASTACRSQVRGFGGFGGPRGRSPGGGGTPPASNGNQPSASTN